MAVYWIEPDRSTLHGTYSREFSPVLTVEPGDTVRVSDPRCGLESAAKAAG